MSSEMVALQFELRPPHLFIMLIIGARADFIPHTIRLDWSLHLEVSIYRSVRSRRLRSRGHRHTHPFAVGVTIDLITVLIIGRLHYCTHIHLLSHH
jgi:hypothetical protein